MGIDYAYPPQLSLYVRHEWELAAGAALAMEESHLERVLTIAYQASLLRDEDRPVRVRLVVAEPSDFDPLGGPPLDLQPLVFDAPEALTPELLRRLAVGAKYHRALVGVRIAPDGRLLVWGILQSGPGWIQVAQGGRGPAPSPPPSALVVRILGAGRIAVGRGSTTLAELRGGVVGGPGLDVFASKWLPSMFAGARAELRTIHAEARAQAEAGGERWATLGADLVTLVSQAMVRRFLAAMVAAHHGGAVIVLPDEGADAIVGPGGPLRLRYAFRDTDARRRYRRILRSLMADIARAGGRAGLTEVDVATYAAFRDTEVATWRDAIFEMSQLIAALTEVDGAVVMNKRYELLGFGAEIAGDLPDVQHVERALDLEAGDTVRETLTADGTRHRSAYRLCSRVPEAVALVVSQDGGVRFIAKHEGEVTFWEHAAEAVDV
ncbi:MAG: putative sensor domain DACNV-containing protein [Polyangiaceae bacterium]